ncbi:hypothetical protein HZS_1571 [Henneguya salminicola]|nr:hypothetical protein HZS_1571 [Henneguya salminicola]
MSSSIVVNNYSNGKNGPKNNAAYYWCSNYKSGCKIKLVKQGMAMTENGVHTWEVTIHSEEMPPNDYINGFLT